jgi:hypothetical protein
MYGDVLVTICDDFADLCICAGVSSIHEWEKCALELK